MNKSYLNIIDISNMIGLVVILIVCWNIFSEMGDDAFQTSNVSSVSFTSPFKIHTNNNDVSEYKDYLEEQKVIEKEKINKEEMENISKNAINTTYLFDYESEMDILDEKYEQFDSLEEEELDLTW